MLRSIDCQLVTDVLEQPVMPIFKGQAVQRECQEHLGMQLYRERCAQ
jgi:hypothetical protein